MVSMEVRSKVEEMGTDVRRMGTFNNKDGHKYLPKYPYSSV